MRDTRREGQLVGGTNKKHMVKYEVDVSQKLEVRCPLLLSNPLHFRYDRQALLFLWMTLHV